MRGSPIPHAVLKKLYITEKKSAAEVAQQLGCSVNKVHYWIARRGIKIRTRSDASYIKHNPNGDPFKFSSPKILNDAVLFGLGLGLYWGEGNKKNKNSVRLGNTDPQLIKTFLVCLQRIYGIKQHKIRFGLQIFSDMDPQEALAFWKKELGFPGSHFGRPVVTAARSVGSYREKTRHGVLTIYFANTKLRNLLVSQIEKQGKLS